MILEIDFDRKSIWVKGDITFDELFTLLDTHFPNGEWLEYKLVNNSLSLSFIDSFNPGITTGKNKYSSGTYDTFGINTTNR